MKVMENAELFEKIDELVNDENKIVTFTELSVTFDLHINEAKRVLEDYHSQKKDDGIRACYFVTGLIQNEEAEKPFTKMVIVPQRHLEAVRNVFKEITSCHIYSVQKFQVKDASTLYTSSILTRSAAKKCKSAISNSNIVISSKKKGKAEKKMTSEPIKNEPKKKLASPNKKKASPLEQAFSKTLPAADRKESESKVPPSKAGKKGKKAPPAKNALLSYMKKGNAAKKTTQAKVEEVVAEVKDEPIQESIWTSSEEEEEVRQPSKRLRRRIKQMSESESEEDQKPSKLEAESPIPKKELFSSAGSGEEDPIPPTPNTRLKSQYKLVTKTYQDDEGFIVTKKEKEFVQEETTEEPSPPKKKTEKVSPPESAAAKKKQMSLTSFFKKK